MTSLTSVSRHQDIDVGHRVVGHEAGCSRIHGHTYRIHFSCKADKLDDIGRIIDFGVIKSKLCQWLLDNWDHHTILWEKDPFWEFAMTLPDNELESFVPVPFNPTAENIAEYLLTTVGPEQLSGTNVTLGAVKVGETYKCSAYASI